MSTAPETLEGIFERVQALDEPGYSAIVLRAKRGTKRVLVRMKTEDIDRKLIGRFIRLTAVDEK